MTSPWMASPYGTAPSVIDGVMQTPSPPPNPVPIPGMMPLPIPLVGAPFVPAPFLGVPPAPVPYMGMPGQPISPFGVPPAPAPFLGMPWQQPIPPFGVPPAPIPFLGLAPQPFPPTPWHTTAFGGRAVSPVTAAILSQLALREAVSHIGDEALKQRVIRGVNDTLDRTIDGVVGIGFQPWFGPGAGAQFLAYPVAVELALMAHRYPDGALRHDLLTVAGQILQKSTGPIGEGPGPRP